MNTTDKQTNIRNDEDASRPIASGLHPRVSVLFVGLAAWFALAVWGFSAAGMTDYLLFIVSGFIFVVVPLTLILSRVGRKHSAANSGSTESGDRPSLFRDWMAADFEVWEDRLSGMQAAILILLPIVAAAIDMTAFAIVFHMAERGA